MFEMMETMMNGMPRQMMGSMMGQTNGDSDETFDPAGMMKTCMSMFEEKAEEDQAE